MRFFKNGIKRENDHCLIVIGFTYVENKELTTLEIKGI